MTLDEVTFLRRLYRTFNISPVSRQSRESFKYIKQILTGNFAWTKDGKQCSNLPNPEKGTGLKIIDFISSVNETLGEIKFKNNSIHYSFSSGATEGASYQGLPAGYISFDEAIESKRAESEIGSMVSRLGDYGVRFDVITSTRPTETANSQQFIFHEYNKALKGNSAYKLITGTYDENVFVPESQKVKHRARVKRVSPHLYDQIISGKFVTLGAKMYDPFTVEHMWNKEKTFTEPTEDGNYIIAVDWGFADKGDESVFIVFDYSSMPWTIVKAQAWKGADPWNLMATLRTWKEVYNKAKVIMDVNAMGGVVMKKMLYDIKPINFDSHSGQKPNALSYLQLALTKGRKYSVIKGEVVEENPNYGFIRSYYLPDLGEQLVNYQEKDTKLKQDWVCTLYMGVWWLWKHNRRALNEGDKPYKLNLLKENKLTYGRDTRAIR